MFNKLCAQVPGCNKKWLESLLELAVEIAREGREGRRIGTLFTFGDHAGVLEHSREMILDPLAGHPDKAKHISDPNMRGTVKELAQLDGAFVVSNDGVFISACRYLDASASAVGVPLGLGSRHLAGASITKVTQAKAIVVSASSMVRVFDKGEMIGEIIPEVWLLNRQQVSLAAPFTEEHEGDLAVLVKEP